MKILSTTGDVLYESDDAEIRECVIAAVKAGAYLTGANLTRANLGGANLTGANLARANLGGANLTGAYLAGADILDGGQDKRGFRFWAWCDNGTVVYRAGCHEWREFLDAETHYGMGYESNGDREECLARLRLLRDLVIRRWSK